MKIVIPGGSGYLGHALTDFFSARGDEVVVLARGLKDVPGARIVRWDGTTLGEWTRELEGAEAVINLAGRSVNCRYNARNKREIYDSRLHSTRILGQAIAACQKTPRAWLNASSATLYRHAEDRDMDELTGEVGEGFSVDVCQQWEATFRDASVPPSVRKVALRTAMVFGPPVMEAMGVYEAFSQLVRRGLGGTLGPGTQYVSWLHTDDFCRAVAWLMEHSDCEGAFNLVAPHPLPNREFMRLLREAVGMRVGLPAPAPLLEAGALLMGTETELLLKSRRVVPTRLLQAGFAFEYSQWGQAARAIVDSETRSK